MAFQLDTDLPTPLAPLAWLIGRWEGAGVLGYPTIEEAQFGQEIEFSHDGRPFLSYVSRTWRLDAEGNQVEPLATETGYWRPVPKDEGDETQGAELEVLIVHPTGICEIYLGRAAGARIDLATDLVARTSTAKEYTAATRLYGLVEGDLLWALDVAAEGHALQSQASARLKRV
ncbi:heme-binding beta-barrel domain-containing protein [Kineosporia succinea]|uniref:Ferric nitrobindin-like protein n=1 Tax=Kineosporia succinea TaxID=84632 RepID=A0ABT9P2T0_9ACTN|nr:FABP family protein [Kineosporia succinea]MDP9826991.1 hypothetical protein [Kineosporia succinea]